MFYKNKKGLSDVIATVLIILLAIAAIVIVWGFISSWLGSAGKNLNNQASCLGVDVKPIACSKDGNVTIQINSGTVNGAVATIIKEDGTAESIKNTSAINGVTTIVNTKIPNSKTAKASAIIKNEQGADQICTESPITVPCV